MALIDDIPKTFDPNEAADRYYPQWEAAGMFTPDPDAPAVVGAPVKKSGTGDVGETSSKV